MPMPPALSLAPAPEATPAGPDAFREAMRAFVGNVSVITTGMGEEATGLVVTSAISLSTEPPLILACVNLSSSTAPVLRRAGCFGLSSLGAAHRGVAERFAGKGGVKGPARYEGAEWVTGPTGARLLAGAPAAFDARVEEIIERATHMIVIGRVVEVRTTSGAGALAYWHGAYRPLAE
jgi:flavin reductase (DIM6/NTAB) family NADH-FMN oxidoreductase RutF